MILFKTLATAFTPVDKLMEFDKTRSFKEGARWNSAKQPALYFSANIQNAMLELANYVDSPAQANAANIIGVYEISDDIRLYEIQPHELLQGWEDYPYPAVLQQTGNDVLNSEQYDAILAPSVSINSELAGSPSNAIRRSLYANVILNPTKEITYTLLLKGIYQPIYNNRMFE